MKGILFILIAMQICEACNNTNGTPVESSGKLVIVLCDVSNSLSRLSVRDKSNLKSVMPEIKSYCTQILKSAMAGTCVIFYPVSASADPKALFQFDARDVNENEWAAEKERIMESSKILEQKIDSAANHAEQSTCLMTSINHAFEVLRTSRQNNPADTTPELYVISDMFEECVDSKGGNVTMHTEDGAPLLKDSVLKRLAATHQTADFDKYHVTLNILYVTPYVKQDTKDKIDSVWRIVFKNMNFSTAADLQKTLLITHPRIKVRKELDDL